VCPGGVPVDGRRHFDERWIFVPGEPPAELGIDTDTAKRLLEILRGDVPSLEYMDVGDL
jgi:hypothetical protein